MNKVEVNRLLEDLAHRNNLGRDSMAGARLLKVSFLALKRPGVERTLDDLAGTVYTLGMASSKKEAENLIPQLAGHNISYAQDCFFTLSKMNGERNAGKYMVAVYDILDRHFVDDSDVFGD